MYLDNFEMITNIQKVLFFCFEQLKARGMSTDRLGCLEKIVKKDLTSLRRFKKNLPKEEIPSAPSPRKRRRPSAPTSRKQDSKEVAKGELKDLNDILDLGEEKKKINIDDLLKEIMEEDDLEQHFSQREEKRKEESKSPKFRFPAPPRPRKQRPKGKPTVPKKNKINKNPLSAVEKNLKNEK